MKKVSFFLMSVCIVYCSCTAQNFVQRGVVEHYFITGETNSVRSDTVVKSKIWFLDSALIYENVTINFDINDSAEFVATQYTYIDLRTWKAEEYRNFRDTAKPFCSFTFDSSYLTARYVCQPKVNETNPVSTYLPDLQENGKTIKRVSILNDTLRKISYVYYLGKTEYSSIFTMNPFIDNRWPLFKVYKLRVVSDYDKGFSEIGYRIIETNLSQKVVAIFESWKQNALKNDLEVKPVIGKESPCRGPFHEALDHRSL